MKRALWLLALVAILSAGAWLAITTWAPGEWVADWAPCPRNWGWGPAWLPRPSPLGALSIDLGEGRAKLCYGRPSLRGRTMLGGEAVPWGKLWRTGANEPTTLHADHAFTIGDLSLGPGSYAIYSVPGPESWEIVLNSATRQWGLEFLYPQESEIGRFTVPSEALDQPVETLTFTVQPSGGPAEELVLEWQSRRVGIPLAAAR